MPTYEYRCKKCQHEFEESQKISDPPLKKCPKCKGGVVRLVSGSTFMLKGSGWYKDGYASTRKNSTGKELSGEKKSSEKEKSPKPSKE